MNKCLVIFSLYYTTAVLLKLLFIMEKRESLLDISCLIFHFLYNFNSMDVLSIYMLCFLE